MLVYLRSHKYPIKPTGTACQLINYTAKSCPCCDVVVLQSTKVTSQNNKCIRLGMSNGIHAHIQVTEQLERLQDQSESLFLKQVT